MACSIIIFDRGSALHCAEPADIALNLCIGSARRQEILEKILRIDTGRYVLDRSSTILDRMRETRDCLRLLRVDNKGSG